MPRPARGSYAVFVALSGSCSAGPLAKRRLRPSSDGEAGFGDRLGDVARRDRAVELAALAGLADDDDAQPVELAGDRFRLALAIEVGGLELRPLGLEIGEVRLGRPHRLLLRQEVVAGKARLHVDDLAHLAKLFDAFEQNDGNHHYSPWRGRATARRCRNPSH